MTTAPLEHQTRELFHATDQVSLPSKDESVVDYLYGEHSKPWRAIPQEQCQALMAYALRGRKEKLKQLQIDQLEREALLDAIACLCHLKRIAYDAAIAGALVPQMSAGYLPRKRRLDLIAPILSRHMVDWSDLPMEGTRMAVGSADVVTESAD